MLVQDVGGHKHQEEPRGQGEDCRIVQDPNAGQRDLRQDVNWRDGIENREERYQFGEGRDTRIPEEPPTQPCAARRGEHNDMLADPVRGRKPAWPTWVAVGAIMRRTQAS